MGMYTEIYVNVNLIEDTPDHVINTIKAICYQDTDSKLLADKPSRWGHLFTNGSYYTPFTSVAEISFDSISGQWSLLGKGDIKNYDDEIEKFFDFISPWCEGHFIGYKRYEEDDMPALITK